MFGVCSGMFGVCTGYVYSLDAVCICSFNAAERGPEPLGAHYGSLPFHYAKPLHHADVCGAGALCNNANAPMIWRRFKIYSFDKPTPKVKQLKTCGRCFAEILTVQAGVYIPS